MALWTLFGLTSGKATTPWPAGGSDGQDGVLGMPRYNPEACREGCGECAAVCPTQAIEARHNGLFVDYGRCVVCQLCTEACPTGAMEPSNDWAFGVRDRDDLVWSNDARRSAAAQPSGRGAFHRSLHIRHVDAGSCNGCEVRAARPQQPVLQSPPLRHLLYAVAPFRRSSSRDRTGDAPNARAPQGCLRGHARTALGDGGRNMRCLRRNSRRWLRLRDRPRGRSSRGPLPPRMSSEPGRHYRSSFDVPRSHSTTIEERTDCWLISFSFCRPCFG